MPPIAYSPSVPPWVGQPAEPAAYYGQGMQIGMRLGAEQAANQYRQQQLLLEQQKMAFENQYAMQKQALEIGDIIQKQRATAAFQGMVQSGVDPTRALMTVGASMGMDPGRIVELENMRQYRQAELASNTENRRANLAFQQQREDRIAADTDKRIALAEKARLDAEDRAKQAGLDKDAAAALAQKRERRQAIRNVETDKELVALRDALGLADTELRNARLSPKGWFQTQKGYEDSIKTLEANRSDAAKAVDSKLKELRATYELDAEEPTAKPVEAAGEVAGDNTMPDKPVGRVRVKSPDGKTGTLPADQVDEAVKAGWTLL